METKLTERLIQEIAKQELGITVSDYIDGYGERGKNFINYGNRFHSNKWYVCLEFVGKKGHIELTKYIKTDKELKDFIKYFKKLKGVR